MTVEEAKELLSRCKRHQDEGVTRWELDGKFIATGYLGGDRDVVMIGLQCNTLDGEFFGADAVALRDCGSGTMLTVPREELSRLVCQGRKALDGDSNDAEHDALFSIIEWMDGILSGRK